MSDITTVDDIKRYLGGEADGLNILLAVTDVTDLTVVQWPVYIAGAVWQPRRERFIPFSVKVENKRDLAYLAVQASKSLGMVAANSSALLYLASFNDPEFIVMVSDDD